METSGFSNLFGNTGQLGVELPGETLPAYSVS
jgi:hypothetical protein